MRVVLAVSLLVVTLATAAVAQSQPPGPTTPPRPQPATTASPDQPTFRTGVGVVRVDVTVSGPREQPVDDLTIADFDVSEDGRPQVVQSIQFIRRTGVRPAGDDSSLEITSPEQAAAAIAREDVRLLVIFLDDYHLRYGPLFDHRLKRLLRDFVEAEMKETDVFAVMSPLTPMEDLHLTRTRQDILDRIEHLQGRLGGLVPPRSALEEGQMYLRSGDRARVRAEVTLSALESLANHLGALGEGRKSVLFVSEGPSVLLDLGGINDRLRQIATAANRGNVTIHTLDPRALGESRSTSPINDSLPADTGGRRLANSNDYSKGLRSVMADASAYYLIGYSPERQVSDGKFHEIEVKVHRKGVRVLARKGYWAPTPEETQARPAKPAAPAEITSAVAELSGRSPHKLVESWLGFERGDGATMTTFSWEPATASGAMPRSAIARLEIDVTTGGDLETHVVPVAGQPPANGAAGPWQVRFPMTPGRQKLRIRATGPDDDIVDEWTQQVDVPDLASNPPTLGTLRMYRATTPAQWRALVASQDGVAPAASRTFRRTDRVLVTVPLYADSPDASLRAELVNPQGKTLLTLPVDRSGANGVPHVELPLANLAQAEYVLRVAAERPGRDVASQTMAFAVVP
jgi:VWFA-related protein